MLGYTLGSEFHLDCSLFFWGMLRPGDICSSEGRLLWAWQIWRFWGAWEGLSEHTSDHATERPTRGDPGVGLPGPAMENLRIPLMGSDCEESMSQRERDDKRR